MNTRVPPSSLVQRCRWCPATSPKRSLALQLLIGGTNGAE